MDAKELAKKITHVYTPTPTDKLKTYSDFSKEHGAVGGRLVIVRETKEGTKELNGGYYSARITKFQEQWLPCEGEALACKLVLDHFSNYINAFGH